MQTTEASALRAAEFNNFADFADEHPVGRIALGAGGRLGLRSESSAPRTRAATAPGTCRGPR